MSLKSLLRLRRKIKREKPDYFRPYWWKRPSDKRKKDSWRFPRGIHNKIRKKLKGRPQPVETGYGSPKEVKGLLPNGKKPVLVYSLDDLKNINKEKECIIIASVVGRRKRNEILKKAFEEGIEVWNLTERDKEYLKSIGVNL